MNSKIYIVTVATEIKYYMKYLIESIKKNNGELIILGLGETWKGYNWKFKMIVDFLKKINLEDIVCFIDGYDVICTRNLDDLKNTFINIRNREEIKIIVGHDKVVNPIYNLFQYLYFGYCKNDYINSGTYIGYVKDLLEILELIYNNNPFNNRDDQILLTDYCSKKPENIYIDNNCEIFLVLSHPFNELTENISFVNNELIYNNSRPFFIHGPASTYLDNIIRRIGCDYTDKTSIKSELYNDFWKKKIYYLVPHFLNEKMEYFLIIIFIILIIILMIKSKK